MTGYMVIRAVDKIDSLDKLNALSSNVLKLIAEGWRPLEGLKISLIQGNGDIIVVYTQTMVKD